MNPKNADCVDIILPNYNKINYITECLQSLVKQTYSKWRCIILDSFSNDGSWEVIQEFARHDYRFELHQIPKTVNCYQAWNTGLSKVENSYFCILTSDDVWDYKWLEIAIQSLVSNSNAICAAARTIVINSHSQWGDTALFNSMGERFFLTDKSFPQLRKGIVSSIANYFLGPIYTSIHSLLMRSEILKQGAKFSEDLGSTADYEWYIKLGLYGDFIYHPEIAVGWRLYEGQATQPRSQEENGKFMQIIHRRTKEEIAQKLSIYAQEFNAIADDYDRRILAYHYARPYLVNLRYHPLAEIPRFLKVVFTMPKELLLDFLFRIAGKNYFIEASLATTIRFYRNIKFSV